MLHKYRVELSCGGVLYCAGPQELQRWLQEGRVEDATEVYACAEERYYSARQLVDRAKRRSDVEIYSDIETTLTDLKAVVSGVAEMLKRDRPRKGDRAAGSHSRTDHDDAVDDPDDSLKPAGIAV